ncbi:MAG: PqqD family protein [Pseudomonadota bacterium]|nr:PqqD family protein [Pseudomonadota bacterium]
MDVTAVNCPVRRSDLLYREVANEVVVLDRHSEKIHQLNETAAHVWKHCDGSHSLPDIGRSLTEEYGIPFSAAEADVTRTVSDFATLGLLEANGNTASQA